MHGTVKEQENEDVPRAVGAAYSMLSSARTLMARLGVGRRTAPRGGGGPRAVRELELEPVLMPVLPVPGVRVCVRVWADDLVPSGGARGRGVLNMSPVSVLRCWDWGWRGAGVTNCDAENAGAGVTADRARRGVLNLSPPLALAVLSLLLPVSEVAGVLSLSPGVLGLGRVLGGWFSLPLLPRGRFVLLELVGVLPRGVRAVVAPGLRRPAPRVDVLGFSWPRTRSGAFSSRMADMLTTGNRQVGGSRQSQSRRKDGIKFQAGGSTQQCSVFDTCYERSA